MLQRARRLSCRFMTIASATALVAGCGITQPEPSVGTAAGALTTGAVTATLVLNDWGSGYTADVRISNSGPPTTSWTVIINLGGSTLTNSWNATLTSSNGTVTARNASHNAALPSGTTSVWGFQGVGVAPARPTLVSLSFTTSSGGSSGSGGSPGSGGRVTTGSGGSAVVRGTGGAPGTGGAAAPSGGGTSLPPIQTGCSGYATRFWDCCKPHCGWQANVPSGTSPVRTCSLANAAVDSNTQSACGGGEAFQCWSMAPWQVSSTLSYGFAATSNGDICGRCFQLQFTGASFNAGADPGSSTLTGKTMVVQALNVGGDVGNHQFDLLVPGGGVGQFNACSKQWNLSASDLGAQYGGFLATCKQQLGGNGAGLSALKSCVAQKCTSVFASRSAELAAGCRWFVDWFQVADNPALKFREVRCPAELTARSGMSRGDVANSCPN